MLRVYVLYHRELLGELSRAAAETAKELSWPRRPVRRRVSDPGRCPWFRPPETGRTSTPTCTRW
jgi:hypothetical protein